VLSSHIRQLACHIGDHIIPFLLLLLTNNYYFYMERIIKEDKESVINSIQNPIIAFTIGNTLQRYEKREFTIREFSTFSQDILINEENTSKYHSVLLWRNHVITFIEMKIDELSHKCYILPENRSLDDEVIEVMKRKKIQKLIKLRYNLSKLLGIPVKWNLEERMSNTIPLIATEEEMIKFQRNSLMNISSSFLLKMIPKFDPKLFSSLSSAVSSAAAAASSTIANNAERKSIYTVLREYNLLTGRLAMEAKALRGPWLERDARLIVNGFLKQSRKDFLELRLQCMTTKQKEGEKEKQLTIQRKQEKKEKLAEQKLQKKINKAKKAAAKKKKQKKPEGGEEEKGGGKKGKKKSSKGNTKSSGKGDTSDMNDDLDDFDDSSAFGSESDGEYASDTQSGYSSNTDYSVTLPELENEEDEEGEEGRERTGTADTLTDTRMTLTSEGGAGEGGTYGFTLSANGDGGGIRTTSNGGGGSYSIYDENDINNNQIFNLKELFNDSLSSLGEEREMIEEKTFQQRIVNYLSPIYCESWIPMIWKTYENKSEEEKYHEFLGMKTKSSKTKGKKGTSKKGEEGEEDDTTIINTLYSQRLLGDLKIITRRILALFQNDETFGHFMVTLPASSSPSASASASTAVSPQQHPLSYSELMNKYGGISFYIIEKTLNDKCLRNDDFVSSPLWLSVPSSYWNIRFIKQRLLHEFGIMNSYLKEFKQFLTSKEESNEMIDKSIKDYEKYVKLLRSQMIFTIEKQKMKFVSDDEQKLEKIKIFQNIEKQLMKYKQQESNLSKKLSSIKDKINCKQYEYALFLLNSDLYPLPENYLENLALASALSTTVSSFASPNQHRPSLQRSNTTSSLGASSPALLGDSSPKKGGLRKDKSRRKSSILVSEAEKQQQIEIQLTLIHSLLEEEQTSLQTIQDNIKENEKKLSFSKYELKNYNDLCYRTNKLLKNFAEEKFYNILDITSLSKRTSKHLLTEETTILKKQKRFRSYRKYFLKLKSFYEVVVLNKEKELIALAEKRKFEELMKVGGRGTIHESSSSSSTTRTPSQQLRETRRTKVIKGLSRGQSKKSLLSNDEVPSSSPFSPNAEMNFDVFASDSGMIHEEPLHDAASLYGEDSTVNSSSLGPESITRLEEEERKQREEKEAADRPLTVDEEIALLHYNSPEAIAKREAELNALEAEQAKETAVQELRMKVFDEYWQSFPRKEVEELELSPRDDDMSSLDKEYASVDEDDDISNVRRYCVSGFLLVSYPFVVIFL
jgi:hypothetical protein